MALNSYDNLRAAIADYLDRPDLAAQIPDFVELAEARHRRDIRSNDIMSCARVTFAKQSAPYVALPPRFLQMRLLRVLTDPVRRLQPVTPDQLTMARGGHLATTYCQPSFYCVHEELEFDVSPDQDYVLEMLYYAAFPPLDATNTTN